MLSRHLDANVVQRRRRWMGVLARADTAAVERLWEAHGTDVGFRVVRAPETGLVMVRGRAGGTGQRFNVGEMTVTRAAVEAPDGTVGHGYVSGRDRRRAELAARFDALLQDPALRPALERAVIEPLAAAESARHDRLRAKAAATRVDFFTMVRGD